MNLMILTDRDALGEGRFRLTDHRAEHVREVLKLAPGNDIEVGIVNGPRGVARVATISEDGVELICGELSPCLDPEPAIDLICALPRPQTLKKVLLATATMGVRSLHLVRANRVEKSYFHSPLLEPENYTPFLLEGLSQGKLTRLPQVTVHHRFRPFFEDFLSAHARREPIGSPGERSSPLRLVADLDAEVNLQEVYPECRGPLQIAIGPEGGWVPFELELMEREGFQRFTLGRWVLRVEMAVIATLSQLELLHGAPARE